MTKQTKKDATKKGPKLKGDKEFQTRLISAIFIMIFIVLDIGLSAIYTQTALPAKAVAGWFNWSFTLILMSAALYELTKVMQLTKKSPWLYLVPIGLGWLTFIFPIEGANNQPLYEYLSLSIWNHWYIILLFCLLMLLSGLIFARFTSGSWKTGFLFLAYSCVIVLGFRGFSIISLWQPHVMGFNTLIFVWGAILLTDTFAYLGGRRFGKHKMIPNVSPNKTWEGAAIGSAVAILSATLYGCLFFYLAQDYSPFYTQMVRLKEYWVGLPGLMLFFLAFISSVVGQMGDLMFSWMKRRYGVKDYSHLIPGHGGILDRLDSFLLVFNIMYFISLGAIA